MQKRVLIAFDDPGGGLAVTSLLDELEIRDDLSLKIYSGRLSEQFLKERNTGYLKLRSMIDTGEAEAIINETEPDLLITGTGGGNAEQELRNVAFERKISSIVILDFWKDYSRRWLYSNYPIDKMNDKVCVMDELTRVEMAGDGFPEKNLFVTGHPYLDRLFNNDVSDLNDGYNIHEQVLNNYLFLSQPLEVIGIKDYTIHPLKQLLKALGKLSFERKENIDLTIKLHPSEEMSIELSKIVGEQDAEYLNVRIAAGARTLNDLLIESEVVIGYNTIAMFESRALGGKTISLNVVPVTDSLTEAMKVAGIEIVAPDELMIYECLTTTDTKISKRTDGIFKGGIENCISVILKELNLNQN